MTSFRILYLINIKGFVMRSLLVAGVLATFTACNDNLEDLYQRPTCTMTDAEKETQKALDIEVIKKYFEDNDLDLSEYQTTASGLHYKTLEEGSGDLLKKGDKVEVHYVGKFLDGNTFETSTTFDNSYNRASPIKVVIGGPTEAQKASGWGGAIEGWYEALQFMKVGEEIRVYIPSYMAYGKCGRGSIPPNRVLAFDMKVVKKL